AQLGLQKRSPLGPLDRPVPAGVEPLDLLEGRDLSLIEHVVDASLALVDPHLSELVGGEVPERMGERGPSRQSRPNGQERGGAPDQGGEPSNHRNDSSARRARGPYSGLKRGLCPTRRASNRRASPVAPARLAIIPAW